MKQLMKAIVASSLLLVSCTFAPAPIALKTTTLQLSLSGAFPSDRQLQYLMPGSKARVTVSGGGFAQPVVQVAPISGETASATLSGLPLGTNCIVSVETLDDADQPIPGGRFRTTVNLQEGANVAVLSAASSVRGDVFDALLAAQSELARTLDADRVQEKIDSIKQAQRVGHYGLIDGAAIAAILKQNGGNLAALDPENSALVQTPTALQVKVLGLPDNLQAAVWVTDPVSPKQSGLSNGQVKIQPVKPGTWQLYGRAGSFRLGPVSVNMASSTSATLDFSSAQILPQALPQSRSGAASGILTVEGRQGLVVAGGSVMDEEGHNVATDSVLVFDGTAWVSKAVMAAPVSHPAFTTNGNKLYVMGGYGPSGMSTLVQVFDATTDTWSTLLPPLKYNGFMGAAACIDDTLYLTSGIVEDGDFYGADYFIYKLPLNGSASEWQELGRSEAEPQLRFARFGSAVAAVGRKLYVFGGVQDNGLLMHRVEAYDPVKGTVRELAPMPTARHGAFTWVKGGKVYVMGGINPTGKALATVEVYDVAADTWSVMPQLREARGHAAVGEVNGRCVIAGGNDGYYAYFDVSLIPSVESLVF